MLNSRIQLSDGLLQSAFKRFDADHSGYITVDNVQTVMGHAFDAKKAQSLISEADITMDGQISYQEFVTYVTGERGKYKSPTVPDDREKPACCTIC